MAFPKIPWCVSLFFLGPLILTSLACDKKHSSHDTGDSHTSDSPKGGDGKKGHDHTDDHPEGHDHHEAGHGHGDSPVVGVTLWSEEFELFGEYEAPVAGKETSFLLHLTSLSDFRALQKGTVTLTLDGPAAVSGKVSHSLRPGIFQLSLTPPKAGKYQGVLQVEGEEAGTIEGFDVEVFSTSKDAEKSVSNDDDHGLVEFLKEQQWSVPFETAFAVRGTVIASVEAAGRVETPPGGSTVVSAPVTGRLVQPSGGLARPGTKVKKGQLLASLIPAPSSPEGAAQAGLAVAEAKARSAAANSSLKRAERLIKNEAISMRAFEDASREAKVAEQSVAAARQAAALYSRAATGAGQGSWRLTAPISGTLVRIEARPGATVSPGEPLFSIVDTDELWIVAQVVEQDAARLRMKHNAAYQVSGRDDWAPIIIEGDKPKATVVSVGQTVNPVSRTVEVIYSLSSPDGPDESAPSLRVGGSLLVSLPAGEEFQGLTIPRSALIDQEGRSVVYVQVDGEHFQERPITIGARAGAQLGVLRGLKEGERIVVRGAHLVRLADRARNTQAHGHVH